ncbi:MAG: 50S ribosomal protein L6 [Candidatus Omnitrophica bacterium]|nr:50S ribosomal protein L6 [Candidatus Omnitrophota bacterium]
MSRLGKQPIAIPEGVKLQVSGKQISAEGPKGRDAYTLPGPIEARLEDNKLVLTRADDSKAAKSLHGLSRALVFNIVRGVKEGYAKQLEIQGVGYKAVVQGKNLMITLRFTHPVVFPVPDDIKIEVQKNTLISVSGINRQRVGEIAAEIRSIFRPEPYKGTGIRYAGEKVKKKLGKAATTKSS